MGGGGGILEVHNINKYGKKTCVCIWECAMLLVVYRARVNSPTRYRARGASREPISSRLFTSGLSDLYHRYFLNSPTCQLP